MALGRACVEIKREIKKKDSMVVEVLFLTERIRLFPTESETVPDRVC